MGGSHFGQAVTIFAFFCVDYRIADIYRGVLFPRRTGSRRRFLPKCPRVIQSVVSAEFQSLTVCVLTTSHQGWFFSSACHFFLLDIVGA